MTRRGMIGLTVLISTLGLTGCVDDRPSSTGWVRSYVQSARPAAALEPSEYQRLSAEIASGAVLEASVAAQLREANPQAWSHIRLNDILYFVRVGCSDVVTAADWLVGRLGGVDLTAAPALTQGIFIMMRRCEAAAGGVANPAAADAIANRFNAHMFRGEQARAAAPRPAPPASVAQQSSWTRAFFGSVCAALEAGGAAGVAKRWQSGAGGLLAAMAVSAAASACPALFDVLV
jgi:hypothetical protein